MNFPPNFRPRRSSVRTTPYFGFRGTPVGIDVFKVAATGTQPVIDGGLAGKNGGQIGAGILRAPLPCFAAAVAAYQQRYQDHAVG